MKFLLTSSGLRNQHIADALALLVGKPLSESSILYVITAANTISEDKGWLIDNLAELQKYKFKSIDIIDIATSPSTWKQHFLVPDIICFGGGDEQYLARTIAQQGVKDFLIDECSSRVYMGISAGSMVAGHFMTSAQSAAVFPEEIFEDSGSEPMKFCNFIFIPHLNSEWFQSIRKDKLEKLRNSFGVCTYAVDDETAVMVVDGNAQLVGGGDYCEFAK